MADGTSLASAPDTPELAGEDAPGSRLALLGWEGLLTFSLILAAAAWFGLGALSLLCALIIATALIGRVWAGLSLIGLGYRRSLSLARAFPGDVVTLTATLDNRKPLPLSWVRAEERLPYALRPDDHPLEPTDNPRIGRLGFVTPLGWFEAATLECRLHCRRRGYYLIGPARVMSGDMFGLFLEARKAGEAIPLIVYPRLYDVAALGLSSHQPLGDMKDPLRLFRDPSHPAGLRDYTPDTPFKHIAWAASARQGQLQVKTFEPTVTVQAGLFLAVDSFHWPVEEESFEVAISVVASLASRLIDQRQPVGVFANGLQGDGAGAVVLLLAGGEAHRMQVLESLAKLRLAAASPFLDFFDAQGDALPARMTLCVVAARLSENIIERLVGLRRRGHEVTVLIVGSAPLPDGRLSSRRIDESHLGGGMG